MKYLLLGVAVMLSLQAIASAFPIFDFEQFNHDMNRLTDSSAVNSAANEHKTMFERLYAASGTEMDDNQAGDPMRAPKILYTVTVKNPSTYNVTVSVDYRDTAGKIETTTILLRPGDSHRFDKKIKNMGTWTSSLVIESINIECEGHNYRMDAKDFGIATTTDHLTFTVVGAGKYADAKTDKKPADPKAETFSLRKNP